ncbi:MAG: diguanylate cyclase [Bacillota bacterium]
MIRDNEPNNIQIYDSLTGAYSRAFLNEQLPVEIERARRYETGLSICIIDLDYFKSINDAYGHRRGDEVLQAFVHRLKSMTRKSDVLFRYGGDEFVLLMLNTNKEQAATSVQYISDAFKAMQVLGDPPLNISLSIGIASFPEDASTTEEIFDIADQRCFEAKRRGRGQFVNDIVFSPGKGVNFDNLSRLIERDDALPGLHGFLDRLKQYKRGILGVTGIPGSGRTCFLDQAAQTAKMYDFEVIKLCASRQLRSRAYGVFTRLCRDKSIPLNTYVKEFQELISKEPENKKIIIILDNFPQVDHATLNLLRLLLISKESFCLGLIYSSEPDSIRNLGQLNLYLIENIGISPLSREGVRIWVRNVLSWDPSKDFLDWLYKESGGLPKALKEIISYLLERSILKSNTNHEWVFNPDCLDVGLNRSFRKNNQLPANNLPYALTEFIERENEVGHISKLIDRSRLVTLTGPGGIGKTRLALQVASLRLSDFEDGVFFVSLAPVTQPELVTLTIAEVLEVKEIPGQSVFESLKKTIMDKHCLLILDNFEQVISAAPMIGELLSCSPLLTVLVTSRHTLHISGESVFNVPSLEVPVPGQDLPLERLVQKAACTLFITRAKAVRDDFVVTVENAPLIAELCSRLDGIPLAIELAAANVSQISLTEMLTPGRSRLNWLRNGPCDFPKRHHTLRNTIEWSYSLLSENEQRLFARLAVFTGKFNKNAVEEVVVMGHEDGINIGEGINSLVNKSLLRRVRGTGIYNEVCYEMLETIHEYALECLVSTGDEGELRRRHAGYFSFLAVQAENNLNGPCQQIWLDCIERYHSNIRAALEWTEAKGNIDELLKMAGALGQFWVIRGHWYEGSSRLNKIIEKYRNTQSFNHLLKIYQWAGRLAQLQGDDDKAMSILNEGLVLSKEKGDRLNEADILHKMGLVVYFHGLLQVDEDLWQKSLNIHRELGNKCGIAANLLELSAIAFYSGKYEQALRYCNEGLEISRELGDRRGISKALNRLGMAERGLGNFENAVRLFKEHIKTCEELGDKEAIVHSFLCLAELERSQQNYKLSEEYYNKAFELGRKLGYSYLIGRSLKDLGEIARYQGNYDKASKLYGESLAVFNEINSAEVMWVYRNMAEIEMQRRDYKKAREFYLRCLKEYKDIKYPYTMIILLSIAGLAALASFEGDFIRAARFFGAIDRILSEKIKLIAKDDLAEYERRLTYVRESLDEDDFDKAWNEGLNMSLDQILDYAFHGNVLTNVPS